MQILTRDPKKEKIVKCGEIFDGVFYRKVKPEHYMKMVQGYGIQEDAVHKLKELGCKKVVLMTVVGNLESNFSDWLENDIHVADYGNGKQRFLSLKRMKRVIGGGE